MDNNEYNELEETAAAKHQGTHLANIVHHMAKHELEDGSIGAVNKAVSAAAKDHGSETANKLKGHASDIVDRLSGSGETSGSQPELTKSKEYKSTMKKHGYGDDIFEETLAASSLKPGAKSVDAGPQSKLSALNAIMSAAGGMSKDDLNNFAATMSQFGPGKTYGVGDNSAKNSSTIDTKLGSGPKTKDAMPKLNVKEDIEDMFAGQDLSEEFKESVETLFEAAVSARLTLESARLEEEYETKLQEELSVFQEEINTKLDSYLDYVVEQWMKDNEVAIESTLRNELAEEFMEGLKNLFSEHYIDVPQEKVDVLEALAEKVEALEGKLDEVITENTELKSVLAEESAKNIFEELSADLALTQQDKFAALVEGIEFDGNVTTYEKKLKIIKENYFKNEKTSYSSNIEEETFEGELNESVKVDSSVNRYVQAIAKTIKK